MSGEERIILAVDGQIFRGFGIEAYIQARDAGSSEWIVDGPSDMVEVMEEYQVAILNKERQRESREAKTVRLSKASIEELALELTSGHNRDEIEVLTIMKEAVDSRLRELGVVISDSIEAELK